METTKGGGSIDLTRDQKISRQESEMATLQQRQIDEANGVEEVEMVTANKNSKYQIRKIESIGYVHVWTRSKNLDEVGKNFVYDDRIVMIHAREFDTRVKDGAFKTYDEVEVIHDPRKNAPKKYNFKPDQINVDGPVQEAVNSYSENSSNAEEFAKQQDRLRKVQEQQGIRMTAIEQREEALVKKEKEIAEKEAALKNVVPATTTAAPVIQPLTIVDNSSEGETKTANAADMGSTAPATTADQKADTKGKAKA